jgi:hypothetical protein
LQIFAAMTRWITFLAAAFLTAHGVVHLIGVAAYWRLTELDLVPYKTALAAGRLPVGDAGMRVFGALFLLAAAGFVTVAFGLCVDAAWVRPLVLASTLLSLVLTGLDWQAAFAGAIVDVLLLVVLTVERLV